MFITTLEDLNLLIEVYNQVRENFPDYYICLETGSDSSLVLIGVYGVEHVKSVEDFILSCIEISSKEDRFHHIQILPMIRSMKVTEKYYPDIWRKVKKKE